MRLPITRASDWHNTRQPVPSATKRRGEDSWAVEIETLDDLLKLAGACSSPILVTASGGSAAWVLEVYDDYRE